MFRNSVGPRGGGRAGPVKPVRARAWISEFIGTTLLLFAATVIARWLFGSDSPLAREVPALAGRLAIDGVVTGAVIGLLIISPLGRSSGGHFNPAVTVTMWLLRGIPGGDVGAQLAGSVIGVLAGRAVLGPVLAAPPVDYAALRPASGWTGGAMFAGEALSLALLMAVR
jgi:glycerol uptake facilitator-like aquaporin